MQQHVRYLDELCPGKVQHVLYMVEYMSGMSTVQQQARYLDVQCLGKVQNIATWMSRCLGRLRYYQQHVRYLDEHCEQVSGKSKTCSLPGRAGVREE